MSLAKPRRATRIAALVGAFLIGLWLGRQGLAAVWWVAVIGLGFIWISRRTRLALLGVVVAGLAVGVYRGSSTLHSYDSLTNLIGNKITLVGIVADDPAISDKNFTEYSLSSLSLNGHKLPGTIRVRSQFSRLQRGYQVSVAGKLAPTIGNKQAEFSFGTVQILSDHQTWLERFRQRFLAGIRTALPEPLAGFAIGLLIGARALIPKTLNDQLTIVGLSHLVAVSGYNLTIIVAAIDRLLMRFSRRLALLGSFWLIAGFVIISGGSASIIRAAVVSILSLLAAFYGRKFNPLALIAIAAGATAYVNPDYLLRDLGWQLSFVAFYGILVLAPLVRDRFKLGKSAIVGLLSESLAAQLLTLPLIMTVFGRFSVVAPLANLLVLPMVPIAMLLSLIAGLAGVWLPIICGWLSWPAALWLKLMLIPVNSLAGWHGASLDVKLASFEVIISYCAIVLLSLALWRATPKAIIKGSTQE